MRLALASLLLLLAGCLSSPAPQAPAAAETPAMTPEVAAIDAAPQPGLYDLTPEGGLRKVESLPGLTWEVVEGGATRYSQDVAQILLRNANPFILVQAIEEQTATFSYDVDLAYRPENPVGDPRGSDAICMGTYIAHGQGENGFYFDRAAGRPGTPPTPNENGQYGGGNGHARAGPIYALEQAYGPRFTESDIMSYKMEAGQYVRLSNPLSQYPPEDAKSEGNHWFQNYTLPGAHRVIRIPPSPVFCFRGFSEFDGVEVVGVAPFQLARHGTVSVETRYGATALLNWEGPGYPPHHDASPDNSATISFAGRTCSAGGGRVAALHSFDAGRIEASVAQWTGYPTVVLMGVGVDQDMWDRPGQDTC